MKARVKWVEEELFVGQSGSGHSVVMEAKGGADDSTAPSPMELLLIGMGGCTGFDMVHILKRMRQPVEDVTVEIDAERADTDPKVFTKIHILFNVKGDGLKLGRVEEAAKLTAEKYCSASIMLGKTAEVTHEVKIIGDEDS